MDKQLQEAVDRLRQHAQDLDDHWANGEENQRVSDIRAVTSALTFALEQEPALRDDIETLERERDVARLALVRYEEQFEHSIEYGQPNGIGVIEEESEREWFFEDRNTHKRDVYTWRSDWREI